MSEEDFCIPVNAIPQHIMARTDLPLDQKIDLAIDNLTDKAVQGILDGLTAQNVINRILSAENPAVALIDYLRPDRRGKAGLDKGVVTLEHTQDLIRNEAHLDLYEMMNDLRPGVSDLWSASNTKNLIKELYGEASGDVKALQHAKAWDVAYKKLYDRYKANGGHLKLDRYTRIPISHNLNKMIDNGTPEEWIAFVKPLLKDDAINASKIDDILLDMYNEMEFSQTSIPGTKFKVSKHRSETDVIEFRDSDAWVKYNDMYGDTGMYDSMMDSVTSMAHLIGAMEMFGSNPVKGYDMVVKAVASKLPNDRKELSKAIDRSRKIFDTSMGHLRSTNTFAIGMGNIRNIQTGVKLGGAIIPAMTDTILMSVTSAFIGMPIFKAITRHITTIAGGADKQYLSAKLLLGLEHMMDVSHSTSRYATIYGSKPTAKFAGGILKWSGLQGWTIGAKQSFGIEFNAFITKEVNGVGSAKLTRILDMYGFTDADIEVIKKAERFNDSGVDFIDPTKLPSDVRRKYTGMVLTETKMAVPEADAGVQALLNQGLKQGSGAGEILRTFSQFKMFPTTILANHWNRALHQTEGVEKYQYIANMILGTTMMGVLAVQAKQIVNGEEPQMFNDDPKNNALLLFKGFVQGGSTAYVGDLFGTAVGASRLSSGDLASQIVGPAVNDVLNAFTIVYTGIDQTVDGNAKFPGLDNASVKLLDQTMPNLWQTQVVLQRGILDQLNKATDPQFSKKQYAKQKRLREEGRDYYWKPGDTKPKF